MRLDKAIKIIPPFKISVEDWIKVWKEEFPQYTPVYSAPYDFTERVDNPNPQHFDDLELCLFRTAEWGVTFVLNYQRHKNFDFEVICYQDNIYINPAVYYYGQYCAIEFSKLLRAQLLPDVFTIGNKILYNKQSFKDYCIEQSRHDKFALHNYQVDQDDLSKLNIIV